MSDGYDPLLAALARLMVTQDVPFSELSERLKGHFVAAASELTEQKQTDSLLSLMTGLSRREVARLRAFESKPGRPNHLTRLVALWRSDPDFCDASGPRELPRTGEMSFEDLARRVLQDVHPKSLLLMLQQSGTVDVHNDTVRLLTSAHVPETGSAEQIAYLAENVGDHLRAATENVRGVQPPYFERALHFSGLNEADVKALQSRFSDGQMTLLEELSDLAQAMKAKNEGKGDLRIRGGGYVYSEKEAGA